MKHLPLFLALVGAASVLSLAALYTIRFLALDSCLDSGGVFDYAAVSCRMDVQSLPVGSLVRPPVALALLATGAVFATLSLLLGRRARRGL